MRNVVLTSVLLATILACSTGGTMETGKPKPEPEAEPGECIAVRSNRFAVDFFEQVRAREGNLFFSPFSISTARAMTYAGARGRTAEQMAEVLHLPEDRHTVRSGYRSLTDEVNEAARGEEGVRIEVANALWGQVGYEFLPEFLQVLEEYYDAELNEVDFVGAAEAARERINTWVAEATNGKIEDLIPRGALDAMTRLVLTNAIYFKGLWNNQFDEAKTEQAAFHTAPGESKQVHMMHQKADFAYGETPDCRLLEMPYVGETLSMVVALPPEDSSISELEERLTAERLERWLGALRVREVDVFIPRFKLETKFSLTGDLGQMGMRDAFAGSAADFSGMNGKKNLFVSDVIHKAYVEVNEEGTEAAAATGVVVGITAVTEPPPVFRADRPFLFFIRHKPSGAILFLGRVMDPTAGQEG
jgi:serpin B